MVFNELGLIADKIWREIPTHFPDAELDEYLIMPNHIHGIIKPINYYNLYGNAPSMTI